MFLRDPHVFCTTCCSSPLYTLHIHIYIYTHTYIYAYSYTHIYIYIYINTFTIYIYVLIHSILLSLLTYMADIMYP